MKMTNRCPDDDALLSVCLGDAVDEATPAHLSECLSCRQRLERLGLAIGDLRQAATWSTTTHTPASPVAGAAEPPAKRPLTIGKYIVVGALDEGGQAQVYRALHPALGKDVAIKWGRKLASLESAEQDRLVAEGRLLAELDHPNLARVLDLDFHEGRPFLAMEYVRGRDLHRLTRQQRLTPPQAARIVATVARAVAEAHRRGITHQDITPRNIILGEDGRPRLIDFGLARLRPAFADNAVEPVGGTPGFMAPEQARGEAASIGPASDIFALGGVLYYLLVGQPPFAGDNVYLVLQRTGQDEVDLSPLRAAGAPRTLMAICRRALASDPQKRYPSADALAGDLERYLRQPRRRVLLGLASLALLLVLLVGGKLFHWLTTPDYPVGRQPLIGQVRRGDAEPLPDLSAALPLLSGDRFPIRCDLPHGYHAALFTLDAQGRFTAYADAVSASAGRFDRLSYPPAGGLLKLSGPPGTELLLVCGNRFTSPQTDEVQALVTADGPWPELPDHTAALLDRDGVEILGERPRGLIIVEGDPLAKVEARMEQLRRALCGRYDFVAALTYPHRER
ncbi:MAG TPA: serine/threonine-protein kinase [Gemmataceae bacterium]|nr:serine/threonine-protein kinase [Gemmataceae bacterium]